MIVFSFSILNFFPTRLVRRFSNQALACPEGKKQSVYPTAMLAVPASVSLSEWQRPGKNRFSSSESTWDVPQEEKHNHDQKHQP
jgi:hypothetical protein